MENHIRQLEELIENQETDMRKVADTMLPVLSDFYNVPLPDKDKLFIANTLEEVSELAFKACCERFPNSRYAREGNIEEYIKRQNAVIKGCGGAHALAIRGINTNGVLLFDKDADIYKKILCLAEELAHILTINEEQNKFTSELLGQVARDYVVDITNSDILHQKNLELAPPSMINIIDEGIKNYQKKVYNLPIMIFVGLLNPPSWADRSEECAQAFSYIAGHFLYDVVKEDILNKKMLTRSNEEIFAIYMMPFYQYGGDVRCILDDKMDTYFEFKGTRSFFCDWSKFKLENELQIKKLLSTKARHYMQIIDESKQKHHIPLKIMHRVSINDGFYEVHPAGLIEPDEDDIGVICEYSERTYIGDWSNHDVQNKHTNLSSESIAAETPKGL